MMATFVDAFFLLAQPERRETKRTASSAARSLSLQPTSSACTLRVLRETTLGHAPASLHETESPSPTIRLARSGVWKVRAGAEARRERRGAAPTPAEKEEHAKRKRACTAAAAKRVPPAPECVAATAEEKERREGRRVRRPARYDD